LRRKVYFEYIKLSHEVCRNRIDLQCSEEVMQSIEGQRYQGELTSYVAKCIKDSFNNSTDKYDGYN